MSQTMTSTALASVSTSGLVLNFFAATFSADELAAFAGPYGDERAFGQLTLAQHGCTAWRDTNDGARVYVWRHGDAGEFIRDGFRPVTVTLSENPSLFCRVMLDGVDRHLRGIGFSRLGRNGYVNWAVGNLLADLGVAGFSCDPRIGIFPKILIESFVTRFNEAAPLLGAIVDVAYTTRFDVAVDELLAAGFAVEGRYVKLRPGATAPRAYEGLVIGRVAHVEDGKLLLEDMRDRGLDRVDPSWCVFEHGRHTLDDYLRWRHSAQYQAVQSALWRKLTRFISPRNKLRLIEEFVRLRLSGPAGEPLPISAGMRLSFGPAANPAPAADTFRARDLLAPTYSFDPESPKTHTWADAGLKQFGPYSGARLKGKIPRLLVLAPADFKGQVDLFISQFKDGIHGYEHTYGGFERKYRLGGVAIVERYFPLKGMSAKDTYYNAAVEALEESTDYDLCFVVIREDFKKLAPADNPYFICKALLLSFGITVQDLRIETLRLPERSLQWTLNTIGLASYAKLGGVPFVLKSRQLRQHELILGIGHSIERSPGSRLGIAKQIIGFTTIFRSDGDYLLNTCTPYTDFANYERRLEEVVLKSVGEVAKNEGIPDGDMLRLIFHVYKRTGRHEIQAIQNAIAKLTRFRVEFALLHVNESHCFKLFDRTNPGSSGSNGRSDEATAMIPPRRLIVEIGPRERLVNLIGPQQYRRRGTPTPIRLTLDRSSTFRDLDYLAQQTYEFSCMSWRSFNPGTQPVTIFYSELMAAMNSRLCQVAAWNQELVRTKLKRKLWFI